LAIRITSAWISGFLLYVYIYIYIERERERERERENFGRIIGRKEITGKIKA
jgi:hypothetical protein